METKKVSENKKGLRIQYKNIRFEETRNTYINVTKIFEETFVKIRQKLFFVKNM